MEYISFGLFQVDPGTGELWRKGVKIKLQEQPLQILLAILERPGELVTREELRTRLWANDTYVDFDHSLNAAVRRLRDALGDSAENPRFVETVARRGYRFLAPIHGNGPGEEAEVSAPSHPWWYWLVFAAAGVLILVFGIALGWRASRLSPPPKPLNQRRLTANTPENLVTSGVISPDGKYFVFSDAGGLFLRHIDSGETQAVPIPKDFRARPECWFPDGVHLLVGWVEGPQEKPGIWEISVLGGTPRKLSEKSYWPVVSPDGSQIAFLWGEIEPTEIRLMRADGTAVRTLVADDKATLFGPPAWSPDGKFLAYARGNYVAGNTRIEGRIELVEMATGKKILPIAEKGIGGAVIWAPDGRLIYSAQEPAPNQNDVNLWAIRIDSSGYTLGVPVRLTSGSGSAAMLSITADGKRLAYFRFAKEPDIFITDLEDHGTRFGETRQLTFDDRSDFPYDWTRDNQAVLFTSNRNGAFNIFKQKIDELEPEILLRSQQDVTISRISPDGTTVLYLVPPAPGDTNKNSRLMRIPLAGGPPQQVLVAADINNHQCARAPATTCVLSTTDGGRERFFYFTLEKGMGAEITKAAVWSHNAYDYNWSLSPDGTRLALAQKEGMGKDIGIRLLPLNGGAERLLRVKGDWLGIGSVDWAADGKSLWATAYTSFGPISMLNVELGGAVRVLQVEKKIWMGWAIPSPDGKRLAIWKSSPSANAWMLENF